MCLLNFENKINDLKINETFKKFSFKIFTEKFLDFYRLRPRSKILDIYHSTF